MTPLRKRMIEEMELRNYAPKTIHLYVDQVSKLALYYNRSPDKLSREEIRSYLVHLIEERKLAVRIAKPWLRFDISTAGSSSAVIWWMTSFHHARSDVFQ